MSDESFESTKKNSWKLDGKELLITVTAGAAIFSVRDKEGISAIAEHDIIGIPREVMLDNDKVMQYLSQCSHRLVQMSDKQYKLYVLPKMLGGANIIDPDIEPGKLWPNGVVPYEIDSAKYPVAQEQRKVILQAIQEWNNAGTGFQFIPHTSQKDYLIFGEEPSACYSYVGRVGGPQYIRCNLTGGFNKTSIMHEIGHAIGFHHEQQRYDRDSYVTVTPVGLLNAVNFSKTGKMHGNYDPASIMHYYFDEKMQPKPVITGSEYVGKLNVLSAGDKQAANFLYQKSKNPAVPANQDIVPLPPTAVLPIGSLYTVTLKKPEWQKLRDRANVLYKGGHYGEAFNHAVTLILEYDGYLSNNLQSEFHNLCGLCALNTQQLDIALTYFNKALQFDPSSTVVANNRAIAQQAKDSQWQCVLI